MRRTLLFLLFLACLSPALLEAAAPPSEGHLLRTEGERGEVARWFFKIFHVVPYAVEKIPKGLTNQNYSVKSAQGNFVVRSGCPHAELLAISRTKEAYLYPKGAALGIVPAPFYFDTQRDYLLTPYIEQAHPYGKVEGVWTGERDLVMGNLIHLMRQVHSVVAPATEETPFYRRIVQHYFTTGQRLAIPFPPELSDAYAYAETLSIPEGRRTLCHHDWFWENILCDGERLWLIDWEYADWDDPYFDLAGLCIEQGLTFEERTSALALYQTTYQPEARLKLEKLCMLYALKTALWGYLQKALVPEMTFDITLVARRHLATFWEIAQTLPK